MADKIIRLPQLQRFKTNADAKYQDKLTAGTNITISGNTISAQTSVGQQVIYNTTITSAGWSGTSNTVTVQGITAGDDVEIVGINPTGLTSQQIQNAKLALDLITYGTTSTNSITFYALGTVPSVNIPVTIRKVVNGTLSDGVYGNANITSYSINAAVNTTTDIFTATGNCKVYVSAELKTITENANGDINLKMNGDTILSSRLNPSLQTVTYPRILTATVLMEAGDVLSIQNPFSSTVIQGSYKVIPAGSSQITAITDYSSDLVPNTSAIYDGSSFVVNLVKQGRICVLSGYVRFNAASAADTTLFTVPTGALPSSIYSGALGATILGEITGDNTARNCHITTAGAFRMHNSATPASGYMRFNGTYISET